MNYLDLESTDLISESVNLKYLEILKFKVWFPKYYFRYKFDRNH